MKITIVYDNTAYDDRLTYKWGFSCVIEKNNGPVILFDTGGEAEILEKNLKKLGIVKDDIDIVFISHAHWDHVGGLVKMLKVEGITAYLPPSCSQLDMKVPFSHQKLENHRDVIIQKEAEEIHPQIYSTGELEKIEQSLVLKTEQGLAVVVGCSHSGVENILKAASQFGEVKALIGGLHDFDNYDVLEGLELICPTHCTQNISEIRARYPEQYISGGAGRIIEI